MGAYLFAQLCFALFPLFAHIPAAVFRILEAILLAGAVAGAIAIVRVVRSSPIRGRSVAWLIVAAIAELLCARLFVVLAFPWL
jgi:hypothetical protein